MNALGQLIVAGLVVLSLRGYAFAESAERPDQHHEMLSRCIDQANRVMLAISGRVQAISEVRDSASLVLEILPTDLKVAFSGAGKDVRVKIDRLLKLEVIHSPFSNVQLMSEALWYQYFEFESIIGCETLDAGVVGEIVEDGLYLSLVRNKELEGTLNRAGLEDLAELRRALFFALILESSGLNWSTRELVAVFKYRFEPADEF